MNYCAFINFHTPWYVCLWSSNAHAAVFGCPWVWSAVEKQRYGSIPCNLWSKKAPIRVNNPSQSLALKNLYETIKIIIVGWWWLQHCHMLLWSTRGGKLKVEEAKLFKSVACSEKWCTFRCPHKEIYFSRQCNSNVINKADECCFDRAFGAVLFIFASPEKICNFVWTVCVASRFCFFIPFWAVRLSVKRCLGCGAGLVLAVCRLMPRPRVSGSSTLQVELFRKKDRPLLLFPLHHVQMNVHTKK